MDDEDDISNAILRAMAGYNVDPTKVRYRKIGDGPGWQPETTQGTPIVRKVTAEERREIEREPEPLGWHYITITEEDDDNNTGAGER